MTTTTTTNQQSGKEKEKSYMKKPTTRSVPDKTFGRRAGFDWGATGTRRAAVLIVKQHHHRHHACVRAVRAAAAPLPAGVESLRPFFLFCPFFSSRSPFVGVSRLGVVFIPVFFPFPRPCTPVRCTCTPPPTRPARAFKHTLYTHTHTQHHTQHLTLRNSQPQRHQRHRRRSKSQSKSR